MSKKPQELSGDAKFLFFTMMQAAIKMHDMGKTKEEWLDFALGIWESLEMNDKDELYETIQSSMLKDLKDFIK